MAADAVNFRFDELQAELTFRHQKNFVLQKSKRQNPQPDQKGGSFLQVVKTLIFSS